MQTLMQTMNMEIRGLVSEPAKRGVRSALECIRGVARVRIGPDERHVSVTYDAFRVSLRQFNTAVRVMGCEVVRTTMPAPHAPVEHKIADTVAGTGAIRTDTQTSRDYA